MIDNTAGINDLWENTLKPHIKKSNKLDKSLNTGDDGEEQVIFYILFNFFYIKKIFFFFFCLVQKCLFRENPFFSQSLVTELRNKLTKKFGFPGWLKPIFGIFSGKQ